MNPLSYYYKRNHSIIVITIIKFNLPMEQETPIIHQHHPQTTKKIQVKSITWKKSSHSLFDYEMLSNLIKNQVTLSLPNLKETQPILIYRNKIKNNVRLFCVSGRNINSSEGYWADVGCKDNNQQQNSSSKNAVFLENVELLGAFSINKLPFDKTSVRFHNSNEFQDEFLDRVNEKNFTDGSFSGLDSTKQGISMIVRSFKNEQLQSLGYPLKTGQKLKLGRLEFKVTVISNEDTEVPVNKSFNQELNDHSDILQIDENKSYNENIDICKVCLSYSPCGQRDQYFLFSPCKCSGSCGLIHFECLKGWWEHLKCKSLSNGDKFIQWDLTKFKCQVCKTEIAERYRYKNKIYEFSHTAISFEKPYLCLENINQKNHRFLFIKNSLSSPLTLGRSANCQIKVAGPSVSRRHARIQFKDGQFSVFDEKSKYGTIVEQSNLQFNLSVNKKGVQIGRTVITFSISNQQEEIQNDNIIEEEN